MERLHENFVKHVTETGGSAFYNLTIASRMYGRMSSSLLQSAEVAGNLILMGKDNAFIRKATALSEEAIERLREQVPTGQKR